MPLAGGMGSNGQVVRVGATVRRPLRPHSPSVGSFLLHLESVGFEGAPRFLGTDTRGREILTYLEGDVGLPPFDEWVASESLLVSVAELQRELHTAARSFVEPETAMWDRANAPEPDAAAIVCHNDLCIENVVVRDGRAVGFIDFDFAAPTDRRFDIAVAARHWAPIKDPVDLTGGLVGLDQIGRFGLFCDAHELGPGDRRAVVEHLGRFLDRALVSMRIRADAGNAIYRQVWDAGYPDQNRRARAFVDTHAAELAAATRRER